MPLHRQVCSSSQPCPRVESSTPCTLERNRGISSAFGAFRTWQLLADSLLHTVPSWPWEKLGRLSFSGECLCKDKDLISTLFIFTLVLQGLEEDSSLSICSLAAQIILTLREKNITTVIYPTSLALRALKSMGEVAPILGRQLCVGGPEQQCQFWDAPHAGATRVCWKVWDIPGIPPLPAWQLHSSGTSHLIIALLVHPTAAFSPKKQLCFFQHMLVSVLC